MILFDFPIDTIEQDHNMSPKVDTRSSKDYSLSNMGSVTKLQAVLCIKKNIAWFRTQYNATTKLIHVKALEHAPSWCTYTDLIYNGLGMGK